MSLRGIANAVGAIGVLLGAAFAIDSRYVSAGEFKKEVMIVKDSILDLHRARLEDEIFRLELIPEAKRTQADKALIERYKSQIKEIDSKRGRSN